MSTLRNFASHGSLPRPAAGPTLARSDSCGTVSAPARAANILRKLLQAASVIKLFSTSRSPRRSASTRSTPKALLAHSRKSLTYVLENGSRQGTPLSSASCAKIRPVTTKHVSAAPPHSGNGLRSTTTLSPEALPTPPTSPSIHFATRDPTVIRPALSSTRTRSRPAPPSRSPSTEDVAATRSQSLALTPSCAGTGTTSRTASRTSSGRQDTQPSTPFRTSSKVSCSASSFPKAQLPTTTDSPSFSHTRRAMFRKNSMTPLTMGLPSLKACSSNTDTLQPRIVKFTATRSAPAPGFPPGFRPSRRGCSASGINVPKALRTAGM